MDTVISTNEIASQTSSKIRWGAIFAGATLSAGLWVLFHVIGLAAGLTAIDPNSPGSLRAAGIGTGVWSVIATLIALFAGGAVVAYVSGAKDRMTGALHGAVLWSLTTVFGMGLFVSMAGMVIGGTARLGGAVAGASGLAALQTSADPLQALGLDGKDLLAPINQGLHDQGKPAVTPNQLQAAVKESVQETVRLGRFDREILITALARNTALSPADVESLVVRIGERLDRIQTAALQAAEDTGKGLWWVFGMLLFGLGAAAGGALLGTEYTKRHTVVEEGQGIRFGLALGPPAHVHP